MPLLIDQHTGSVTYIETNARRFIFYFELADAKLDFAIYAITIFEKSDSRHVYEQKRVLYEHFLSSFRCLKGILRSEKKV